MFATEVAATFRAVARDDVRVARESLWPGCSKLPLPGGEGWGEGARFETPLIPAFSPWRGEGACGILTFNPLLGFNET